MPAFPSPENPPSVVRPFDVFDCLGCGQRLRFDRRGFVPQPQLDGCRSLCDWTLVERDGRPAGPSDPPAERLRHG